MLHPLLGQPCQQHCAGEQKLAALAASRSQKLDVVCSASF